MRNSYLKILAVLLLFFLVVFLIWKNGFEERSFKEVDLHPDITIYNKTDKSYYDTILNVGLSQMNLKPIVTILKLSVDAKLNFGGELKAHVRYFDGTYILFIDDLSRTEAIDVISHEIIHINQYETGKIAYENGVLFWNNEEVDFQNIPYENRPWEIEAFEKQNELSKNIELVLY